MSVSDSGSGYDEHFFDAESFSFSDTKLDNVPLARGVQFNPFVSVFGGSQIPLAAGDGYWDTLQYEKPQALLEDSGSLNVGDLEEEGPMPAFNQRKSLSNNDNNSMSLADINNSPKAPPPAEGGGRLMGVAHATVVDATDFLKRGFDFVAKAFKDDESDEDLIIHNDLDQRQLQEHVPAETTTASQQMTIQTNAAGDPLENSSSTDSSSSSTPKRANPVVIDEYHSALR